MIVYLLLNTVNNKGYVGKHKGDNISTRWQRNLRGGNRHLEGARLLYGPEAFRREILNVCFSKEEMNNLEKLWILTLRTYDPEYGYNMTMGGEGGHDSLVNGMLRSDWAKQKGHGKWNKGRTSWKKGKTIVECFGEEKAKFLLSINGLSRRGKTAIEIYGVEKAAALFRSNSKPKQNQRRSFFHICYSCFNSFRLIQESNQVFCSKNCRFELMRKAPGVCV